MTSQRFLTTILCDDVRREEGNKLSYMGIYIADVLLASFPATLPKLCFVMNLCSPGEMPPPKGITFLIFNNETLLAELRLDEESIANYAASARPEENPESLRLSILNVAQLVPMKFDAPCELKVRAICDGEEVRGGRWKVGLLPTVVHRDVSSAIVSGSGASARSISGESSRRT